MKATLIGELACSADESHAQERSYHAFRTVRTCLDELEAHVQENELFRDSVTAVLEAHSRQLASLVRVYERARQHRPTSHNGFQAAA